MNELDDLLKNINNFINSRPFLEKVAVQIIDVIYKRTKNRKGLSEDSDRAVEVQLAELSQGYKNWRKNVVLGKFGSPTRSNATLTGQMLESIFHKVVAGGIIIDVANTPRSPIRLKKKTKRSPGGSIPQTKTNKQISDDYSKNRPYLGLTVKEQEIIANYIDRELQKYLDTIYK